MKQVIETAQAPAAIGTYSQAINVQNTIYLSGQIPLDPKTGNLIDGDIDAQIKQVLENLKSVAEAAGGNLDQVVKLSVFLTDLNHLPKVNEIMKDFFTPPYPARTSIQVAALPKAVAVEIDAIMILV